MTDTRFMVHRAKNRPDLAEDEAPSINTEFRKPEKAGTDFGARKYTGESSRIYDAKRQGTTKWNEEQQIIESWLQQFPPQTSILDIPVGTGRFAEIYSIQGFRVTGVDVSGDQLAQAREKFSAAGVDDFELIEGNILKLQRTKESEDIVDASLMVRMTRWLSLDDCILALRNLQHATRKSIILTARIANHPHARPIEELLSDLGDGWSLVRDVSLPSDPDYHVMMLGYGE